MDWIVENYFRYLVSLGFDVTPGRIGVSDGYWRTVQVPDASSMRRHVFRHLLCVPRKKEESEWFTIPHNEICSAIALPQHPDADVICIDLDFHGSHKDKDKILGFEKVYKNLCIIFQTEAFAIYRNRNIRGWHTYWKINRSKKLNLFWDVARNRLKDLRIPSLTGVDFRTNKKPVRIPFSDTYETISVNSLQPVDGIRFAMEEAMIQKVMVNAIDIDAIISLMDGNRYERKGEVAYLNRFGGEIKNNTELPFIYAGNRVGGDKTWIQLGFRAVREGWDAFEFARISGLQNRGSKDIQRWKGSRLVGQCEKLLKWCKGRMPDNQVQSLVKEFKSNTHHLTRVEKRWIREFINSKYEGSNVHDRIYREALHFFMPEFVGKIRYETLHPRRIKPKVSKAYGEKLLIGAQFPRIWLRLVSQHYGLKTDARRLLRTCIKDLWMIQYFANARGYGCGPSWRHCKQYITSVDILNVLKIRIRLRVNGNRQQKQKEIKKQSLMWRESSEVLGVDGYPAWYFT